MRTVRPLRLRFAGVLGLLLASAIPASADETETLLKRLTFRNVGPAIMGGRIDDLTVHEKNPSLVYVSTAAGGIFKTVNSGTTWTPVFDFEKTGSIGDMDLCQAQPDVLYVGTGEANNRQSSSWGHGVYKSTDAGKTWTHLGLAETMHIGRVIVHPTNPDVVWVAAVGRLWGPNKERGLYKTTDGGKTWKNTLFINEDTGCTEIALDPSDPNTLYAATYQRRRAAYGFVGGGPGSGLYKSTDGGETWKKLTQGLPTTDVGRIGLDIYRKDSNVVFAIIETKNGNISGSNSGSIFRSTDKGETWKKVSDTNPRPMYFSQIRVDPNDQKKIWVLGAAMYTSTDGGETFSTSAGSRIHADHHALWINPANSNHVIDGCDGGLQWSYDGGRTWDFVNTIVVSQFYEVCFDYRKPYRVYGGLQDNGSWGGSSTNPYFPGPTNDDWYRVGQGDGFYVQVDPTNPDILYSESQNGAIRRYNQATLESKDIQPDRKTGDKPYRFDWNSPILISPHNPKKILFAGNRLFLSTDRGDSWRRTDDLTTNPDREKLPIMGGFTTKNTLSRHDGQDSFGQIVTVSESPVKEGILYVGTDDGNLQVSKDDGLTWKNVVTNVPGLPKGTYVSRVLASVRSAGTVYATFDGHRSNDFKPYVYVSEDYGQTWQPLTNGLPDGDSCLAIREHFRTPGLLFLGTERSLFVSFDQGNRWRRIGSPLPTTPIHDIQIHPRENDLILGTHGRGIWISDDIGPLEKMAQGVLTYDVVLANPRPAVAFRSTGIKGNTGHKLFVADNAPSGGMIQFLLRGKAAETKVEDVKITILDREGKQVLREVTPFRVESGWNRAFWDLRQDVVKPTPGSNAPGGRRRGGGGFFARGPRVLPGTYLVRLTVGKEEHAAPIVVEEDSRLKLSAGERKTHFQTLVKLYETMDTAQTLQRTLADRRTKLTTLRDSEDMKKAPQSVKDSVTARLKQVEELQARIVQRPRPRPAEGSTGESGEGGAAVQEANPPLMARLNGAVSGLESLTEVPSRAIRQEADTLAAETKTLARQVNEWNAKELPSLNKELKASKIPEVSLAIGTEATQDEVEREAAEEDGEKGKED